MHEELFGHLLAAMRFGADEAACQAAIEVAFRWSSRPFTTMCYIGVQLMA